MPTGKTHFSLIFISTEYKRKIYPRVADYIIFNLQALIVLLPLFIFSLKLFSELVFVTILNLKLSRTPDNCPPWGRATAGQRFGQIKQLIVETAITTICHEGSDSTKPDTVGYFYIVHSRAAAEARERCLVIYELWETSLFTSKKYE